MLNYLKTLILHKKSNKGFKNVIANNCFVLLITVIFTIIPTQPSWALMPDHQAALELVPLTAVDRQVVQSGLWSNPDTWSGGVVPKAGENIYVPIDKSLTVDIESDLGFNTLRVDGIINFALDQNVSIKLDTLVVTETGTFEVGSESERVPANINIRIYIANNGPIDRSWDPSNISRGVIIQGKTRIYGAEKSAYHTLSVKPAAGSTQIKLDTIPIGWKSGDIIAITAAKFRKKLKTDTSYQTEDELRRIQSISGNIITLGKLEDLSVTAPLTYRHIPTISKMPVFAANLTRNVAFIGEGGGSVPTGQRGHFVVMHNPDAVIKGASFNFFGRTDKSIPLNDFKLDSQGFRLKDAKGNYIPDINTNPRGRYAVHFHHTGTDINIPPAICSGNAVFSSNGWGFVNHTSNVIMENNASYNVYGSHYVSEDGNELGAFRHNIAIKSEGRNTIVKTGLGNHDHGHTGHGFWLQSRNLSVEDNVVSGVYDAGVVYYHRNAINGINLEIPWQNLLTNAKGIVKGMSTIYFSHVPITDQKNTTVLSSGSALNVIKSQRGQEHDARNMIESLKGYSLLDGLQLQYTQKYTFTDLELIADPATKKWNKGVNVSVRDRDIAFINTKVGGFVHPFVTGFKFLGLPDPTDVIFADTIVNGRPIEPAIDIHQPENQIIGNYDPSIHKVMGLPVPDLNTLNLDRTINTDTFNLPLDLSPGFTITGTKTDAIGDIPFESTWKNDSLVALLHKGYYLLPDGSKCILLSDVISDRFSGKTKIVYTKLKINKSYVYHNLGDNLGTLAN